MKVTEGDTNRWKDILCSWIGRILVKWQYYQGQSIDSMRRGRKWGGWGVWGWYMQSITFTDKQWGPRGNYVQSLGVEHDGRHYEKMYIKAWLGHYAVQQKLIQHCKSTIL